MKTSTHDDDRQSLPDRTAMRLCEAYADQSEDSFLSIVSGEVYGPLRDRVEGSDSANAQIVQALIAARSRHDRHVSLPGDGSSIIDLLFIEDLVDACMFLLERTEVVGSIEVGSGKTCRLSEFAGIARDVISPSVEIAFVDESVNVDDPLPPLDLSKIRSLGWHHRVELEEGIRSIFASAPIVGI